MRLKCNQAQTLTEMALVFTLITGALIGMQVYLKRGLQARYKAIVDASGDVFGLHQYEPYYASSNFTVTQDQDLENTQANGTTATGISDTVSRQGRQKVGHNETMDDSWNW